jgi:hypothetical protein
LGKLALFQMLQEYTGVRFNIDGHQARLRFAPVQHDTHDKTRTTHETHETRG